MKKILPIIVIAQFLCTSLWFAGNAVMGDIILQFQVSSSYLTYLTSTVQAGFIIGTLLFATLGIADRFSPSKIFFICAVIAATFNLIICVNGIHLTLLFACRFLTGFFLAGIYPIGMKIAADHYEHGLGKSLGFLVGALVLGTAFPHFLKSGLAHLPWKYVIFSTSMLSFIGGLALFIGVPDGPFRKRGQQLKLGAFMQSFRNSEFRAAAFGYFGHMWELYTFWVFIPVILGNYSRHFKIELNISLLSFSIIFAGSLACVISGLMAQRFGTKKIATLALAISCSCCILSPLFLFNKSLVLLLTFLLIWGMVIVADSPLFSTLIAQNAALTLRGSSLTIVNCIGFAITIVSIQFINVVLTEKNAQYIFMLLALGPISGLLLMNNKERKN
ncbi:MFS transporter [Pedobacter sp. Du54]|uniref:MFS transporter n=1 Tax=Pedobacter anseongensis TaxID=3133439 RepID=UPI0030B21F0D